MKFTLFQIRYFYLLAGILLSSGSYCQRYNFNTFSIADGLPNNQINKVIQADNGELWIGTMAGACRYDGRNFIKFEQENLLSHNAVKAIFQDSKGDIWLGMIRKGVCRFDGTSFKFFNMNDGLLSDIINSICEDSYGNIWIGTSEGLNKYDGKSFTSYTTTQGLVNNNVYSIRKDLGNNLWIATIGGINLYDGKSFKNYTVENGLANNIAYRVIQSKDKKIWVGTYSGISEFDGTTFRNYTQNRNLMNERVQDIMQDNKDNLWFATYGSGVYHFNGAVFKNITTAEGLSNNNVKSLFQDREGNFWFGTWNGLCKYSGDRFTTLTTEDGLPNNNILSVFADSANKIWFGTLGGGVSCFDGNHFRNYGVNEGLKSSTIWSITSDRNGNYWFGTTSGPAYLNPNEKLITFPVTYLNNFVVYSILHSKRGKIYFGTDRGVFVREKNMLKKIGVVDGLSNDKVRVLFEDSKGIVWIGTLQGLYYLKGDSAVSFNDLYNIPKAPVTSVIQDKNENLIVSTYDFGIFRYSKTDNKKPVVSLSKKDGLTNNRILFNFLDANQNLWLGTPEGLDCIYWALFVKENKIIINHFDKSNGYFGVESNSACADKNGNIWFGTINGAIKYNLKSGISRQTVPLVSITNIQLFLKDVNWEKGNFNINPKTGLPKYPILNYENNHLSFFFNGIYLTAPQEVQFRFMLQGFEDDWSPPTKQTVAYYSNLSSGSYTFNVQASANLKDWSNPVKYSFAITPPFWKKRSFFLIYAVLLIGGIMLILKIRTRNLKRSQIQLRKKVEMRTRELNSKNIELEKLSLVASETDNAVMIFDAEKELEWVNEGFTKMTGYTLSEIINERGKSIYNLSTNNDIRTILNDSIKDRKSSIYESLMSKKNSDSLWVSSTLNPIFSDDGNLKNIVVIDTDITYRKIMEDQIKASLDEKGLLLKEIHHRVKNNLQIIISLFNLQSSYVTDTNAYKALKEGQERIKSMALIHERFYQADGMSKIDFDDYIRRLAENLFNSFAVSQEKIQLIIESEKIALDIDSAVPCGLIINELISNSLKHAFNGKDKGKIFIGFHSVKEGRFRLEVSDNGIGLPKYFNIQTTESLGMQLVIALTDQLEGTIEADLRTGTKFTIEFGEILVK